MTKKINVSPALIATAVFVKATVKSRCRAGIVFNNETETRVELDKLPEGGLAAIEADPYLKVTYETEEMPGDDYTKMQIELQEQAIQRAEVAEGRILELEAKLAEKDTELATANEHISNLEMALDAKEAEIAELKVATTPKAKK